MNCFNLETKLTVSFTNMQFFLFPFLTKLFAKNQESQGWSEGAATIFVLESINQNYYIENDSKFIYTKYLKISLTNKICIHVKQQEKNPLMIHLFDYNKQIAIHQLEQTKMKGGMFGLSTCQQSYLYACHLVPAAIALFQSDLTVMMLLIQVFYLLSSWVYIKFLSIQKSFYPFMVRQFSQINYQVQKGLALSLSAFLLITVYGIIFIKIGKVALPTQVNLGTRLDHQWWAFLILCLVNPFLQQWYWRLFFPQAIEPSNKASNVITVQTSHLTNFSYLLFHFGLFSKYVGFFRAVPLVGTFFSVGRSMTFIAKKYGIVSSIITHYGISLGGFALYLYLKFTTQIFK